MAEEKNPKKPLPENNKKDEKDPKREEEHDKTLKDTFPASDPPATY